MDMGSVRIGRYDLLRLAELAGQAEADLFARKPNGAGRYAGCLLCRALCQGAALHYVDGRSGVKDFDVWSLYTPNAMMGRSRTDGEARGTTAHRGSAGIPKTLRRIWAAVWTCWDAHSVSRLTLTHRLQSAAT